MCRREGRRSACAPPWQLLSFLLLAGGAWLYFGGVTAGQDLQEVTAPESAAAGEEPGHRVVVRFSGEGLKALLARDVHFELAVEEDILDAHVTGKAEVVSRPELELVAAEDRAAFQLVLRGTAATRTVGEHGAAVIRGQSQTTFTATRPIVFEPGRGFRGLETKVEAETRIVSNDVGTVHAAEAQSGTTRGVVGRVIQRRAAQRMEERRPEATEIARQRAELRIREAVERRIDQRLERLNRIIQAGDRQALLDCCSTPHCVQFGLRGGGASPAAWPPPAAADDAPVAVWIHRTLLGGLPANAAPDDAASPQPRPMARLLVAMLVQPAGFDVRSTGDWLVIEVPGPPAAELQFAQQPGESLMR
jgi:hypothetical protein